MVLRQTKLTETSLIVGWLTEEHGLIQTVARAARQARSPFAGRVDLFVEAEVVWAWPKKTGRSELCHLREVEVRSYRAGIRQSYRNLATASYFAEILLQLLEPGYPVPELYDLLQRALDFLEKKNATRRAVAHFERELGRLQGVGEQGAIGLREVLGALPKSREQCLDLL